MKMKKNTLAQWGLTMALGIWMAATAIVFLSEATPDSDLTFWAIIGSKALAALSGWACVKTAQWLDRAGWLPSIEYFTTNEEGGEL